MFKICLRCNKTFAKKQNVSKRTWTKTKFCSFSCRKNPPRTCPVCNVNFVTKGMRQLRTRVWCSRKCRYSYPTVDYTTHEYRTKANIRISVGKRNAKSRGLSWELTLPVYASIVSKPCSYCNNSLGHVQNETGAGLDRLDNGKGYTLNNVVSCCGFCNSLRSDILTVEETKVAVEAILNLRNKVLTGV